MVFGLTINKILIHLTHFRKKYNILFDKYNYEMHLFLNFNSLLNI